jgi:hypothetical protein
MIDPPRSLGRWTVRGAAQMGSDVDVDMQAKLRTGECRGQRDADAAVLVIVPDGFRRGCDGVEDEPVVDGAGRNVADEL